MTKETFQVVSAYDGTKLDALCFLPEGKPKGIFQILHGMCEYKERYQPFMSFLAEHGYIAAAHDHRGHGNSVSDKSDLGYFSDKTGKAVTEDAFAVTQALKKRYGDLPVILFGHSMGSLVAMNYLQKHETAIEKLVICGMPKKNIFVGVGLFLNGVISLFKGERHRSKWMAKLTLGGANKKFKSEGKNAWLTRDREVVKAYNADEKCNFIFTCNGFKNLLKLLKNTYKQTKYRRFYPTLPILFVAGEEDPVAGGFDGWFEGKYMLTERGYVRVYGQLYQGMRHEILNEIGKEKPYADILAFCNTEIL